MAAEPSTQPLQDAEGNVVGYFVPAAVYTQLQKDLVLAREKEEVLHRQLASLLPVATPEEELEMERELKDAIPGGLESLIAELEMVGQ